MDKDGQEKSGVLSGISWVRGQRCGMSEADHNYLGWLVCRWERRPRRKSQKKDVKYVFLCIENVFIPPPPLTLAFPTEIEKMFEILLITFSLGASFSECDRHPDHTAACIFTRLYFSFGTRAPTEARWSWRAAELGLAFLCPNTFNLGRVPGRQKR